MRYYRIDIANAQTGAAILPSSLGGLPISSLLPNGGVNTAALNVEFDLPVASFDLPGGQALVTIWGLSIKDLSGAFDLNPGPSGPTAVISVYGGMSKGLPLANPAQARLLVKGQIFQCFGNWIGTNQNVCIVIVPYQAASSSNPANFSLNWKAGTTLADALSATLKTAMPGMKQNIKISGRLTLSHDQPGYYASLTQLNQYLNPMSRSIVTDAGYRGVSISVSGDTVDVFDGTLAPTSRVKVDFADLIGQPTWVRPFTVSLKTVMRGDITMGSEVILPRSAVTSSAAAFQGLTGNNPADDLSFSGPYLVQNVHHYGNFRQATAESWATVFEMTKPPTSSGAATP